MMRRWIMAILILACITAWGEAQATDYTFGGDTTGTTAVQWSDSTVRLDTVTSAAFAGNLDSVIAWLAPYSEARQLQFVIYKSDSTILDSTAVISTGTETTPTRYKGNFVNKGAILASTKYLIGYFWTNAAASYNMRGYFNATTTKWRYSAVTPVLLQPKFVESGSTNVGRINMLLYYSSAEAGGTVTRRLRVLQMGN